MNRLAALALLGLLAARPALAETPGVTKTEIRLGQTTTYTGPLAAIGAPIGKAEQAYFRMINDEGGIGGRKVVLESLDDGSDAAKALALTKRMVEQDHVAAIFSPFATAQNLAIEPYLNAHGVPDLFIITGDDFLINRQKYPWTVGGTPVFRIEAQIFGRYILVNMPKAKVGVLYSSDQMGHSYLVGLHQGFGPQYPSRVVKEVMIADTASGIAAEWAALKASGADVVIVASVPRVVAASVVKAHDGDWHPTLFINFASSGTVLSMAGMDKSKGIITANSYLDPTDPRWVENGRIKPFKDFVAKYLPRNMHEIGYYLAGYVAAQAMAQVLRQCGDDLSRQNIMRQSTNLRNFHPVGLIPGITFFTSRTHYLPIAEAALTRFDGKHWVQFGEVMAGF